MVRKWESKKEECVKDVNGEVLSEREGVLGRWWEYFGSLSNVTDERKAEIAAVQGGRISRSMRIMNEVIVSRELVATIKRLKAGKAAEMNGIAGESIRSDSGIVGEIVEWLL